MPTKEHIMTTLRTVHDPELGYDIVRLGLIYDVRALDNGTVEIDATLTSPGCPLAESIVRDITGAIAPLEGVTNARVNIVWDPPYSIKRMDPELRAELFPNYSDDEEERSSIQSQNSTPR